MTYANLSKETKEKIIREYQGAVQFGATDPLHAAAIAACNILCKDLHTWNSKSGTNAYGIALAVLVHNKIIKVSI